MNVFNGKESINGWHVVNIEESYIKKYWDSQGKNHGESHHASWGDNWMIDLEIETIGSHIMDGDKVLDVGCANGYSTFHQYKNNSLRSIVGVDYSENMISSALSTKNKGSCNDDINFCVGDVRELDFEDDFFDLTYT